MKSGDRPFTRRAFLKLSGLLGVTTAAGLLLPAEESHAFLFNKRQYKVSKTRLAMGTFVAMTAIHPSRVEAEDAFGLAFEEIDRLSSLLSRYVQDSPVAELNRSGVVADAPNEVLEVVARSLDFHKFTGGAFDISVKPLLDLYQQSFHVDKMPERAMIDQILPAIDSNNIEVAGNTISFLRADMGITLDGIAKGYIVDCASELLCSLGVENHLINAGGDIRTSGKAAKGKKWKVAIQDPNKEGDYPDIISMGAGAIATSGNYEIYYDREKVFHHIVNGRTGISPQLSSSVSIVAPTVTEADALATAVFVLEPEAGVAFVDSWPQYECFVIDRNGMKRRSRQWG